MVKSLDQRTTPELDSAYRYKSPPPTYTLSSAPTQGVVVNATIEVKFHSCAPVAASSAYKHLSEEVKYTLPPTPSDGAPVTVPLVAKDHSSDPSEDTARRAPSSAVKYTFPAPSKTGTVVTAPGER